MIEFRHRGNFVKTTRYLERVGRAGSLKNLEKYGREGVEALASATPIDSGLTASSWSYEITRTREGVAISFINTNIQNGVPIAIILQHGHGTRNGGWVEGRDYINPAIQPIFDRILSDAWREVTRL